MNAAAFARKTAPFVLLWLALHAAVLAIIMLAWGAILVTKALLGWLLHTALFLVLVLTGAWLVLRLWKAMTGGETPRPA